MSRLIVLILCASCFAEDIPREAQWTRAQCHDRVVQWSKLHDGGASELTSSALSSRTTGLQYCLYAYRSDRVVGEIGPRLVEIYDSVLIDRMMRFIHSHGLDDQFWGQE